MYKAIPVKRGCGVRKAGACYGESGMGGEGFSIEHFLIDPPYRIDAKALGLASVGVKLIERDGVWHVLDIVGQEHYNNVADFVEEARRAGVSRRFPKNLDFSKLTSASRMLLAHRKAWVDNFDEYVNYWIQLAPREYDQKPEQYNPCPKPLTEHSFDRHPEMCAGIWWQDVEQVVNVADRVAERRMPSFTYTAAVRPPHIKPQYQLAIFGSFPLHRLVVIEAKGKSHLETAEKVSKADLPVDIERE